MDEFPKWVICHSDHIGTNNLGQQVPIGFDEYHWDRVSRKFSVLVKDAAEAERANPRPTPIPEPVVEPANEQPEHD